MYISLQPEKTAAPRLPKKGRDIQGAERLIKFSELDSFYKNKNRMDEFNISKAEKRILNLLKQGLQDKEIGECAGISPGTVSTHLRNLYRKTGTQNRLESVNTMFQ